MGAIPQSIARIAASLAILLSACATLAGQAPPGLRLGGAGIFDFPSGEAPLTPANSRIAAAEAARAKTAELPRLSLLLKKLQPTQGAVGFGQVERLVKRFRKMLSAKSLNEALRGDPIEVVWGPGRGWQGRAPYIVDGHHQAVAAWRLGLSEAPSVEIGDWSDLSPEEFAQNMIAAGYCQLLDEKGRPIKFEDLPQSIDLLPNDPFRSLASAVRRKGGFSKWRTHAEVVVANALRTVFTAVHPDLDPDLKPNSAREAALKFIKQMRRLHKLDLFQPGAGHAFMAAALSLAGAGFFGASGEAEPVACSGFFGALSD